MASDPDFIQYVREQLTGVQELSHRKMFGEYALYVGRKVVALVCDNQLFLKPTAAGRALIDDPMEAPPFPGAKPWLLVDAALDDRELLAELVRATEQDLPEPKPKPKKRKPGSRKR